jgi:hypothetical protein
MHVPVAQLKATMRLMGNDDVETPRTTIRNINSAM